MKSKAKKIIPFILFIILPLILFYKIFLGNIVVVGDLSGSDLLDLHLPFKYLLQRAFTQHTLPLWDKNIAMGFPVFAESQIGALYPINIILALLLSPEQALNFSVVSVFVVASISTYIYLKLIGKSTASAIFGSITFAFSAFFVSRIKHLNLVNVASLFPLLLVFTKKYFDTQKYRFILFTALTITLMIFAGHPQIAFYNLFIFIIYVIFEGIRTYKKDPEFAISGSTLFTTVSILLGVLLSAVQALPTVELTTVSERAQYSYSSLTAFPFNPKNIITFLSPYFYGNPANATYQQNIQTFGIFWENASYIGLLGIIFAVGAIITIIGKRKKGEYDKFFLVLTIISFLLVLGGYTPLFPTLIKNVPLLNLFRFPNRFNLYLIFSLSVLSSAGFELTTMKLDSLKLGRNKKDSTAEKELKNPKSATNSNEEMEIRWPLNKEQTGGLFIVFTILDLLVFANSYIGYIPLEKFNQPSDIASAIKESTTKPLEDNNDNNPDNSNIKTVRFRTYSTTPYSDSPYRLLGWMNDADTIVALRRSFPPNNNTIYDIPAFSDRTQFEGGLNIARRNTVEYFVLYGNQDPILTAKILGMYSVKDVLSFAENYGISFIKEDEYDLGKEFGAKLIHFKDDLAIERLTYVPEAEVLPADEVLKKVENLDNLPIKTVLLEDEPKEVPIKFEGSLGEFKKDNSVAITAEADTKITIKANIKNHGFLVLNDTYYPGWMVTVNGKPAKILRANYLVRALELYPGDTDIVFSYTPTSFRIGRIISLITLGGIIIAISFSEVRNFLKRVKTKSQKNE